MIEKIKEKVNRIKEWMFNLPDSIWIIIIFTSIAVAVIFIIVIGMYWWRLIQEEQKFSFAEQMMNEIQKGVAVKEIETVNIELPTDIHQAQIKKYFQLGDIIFALVLQPSMNVHLAELPSTFTPSFVGVLIAHKNDTQWTKLSEIKDTEAANKNNPYYLWEKNGKLLLNVVDQNGAGSGEGNMKIFALSENGRWELIDCYYFGSDYNDPASDGDYFAFSAKLSRQTKQPLTVCNEKIILEHKETEASPINEVGWQTYRNEEYGFEFKYFDPQNEYYIKDKNRWNLTLEKEEDEYGRKISRPFVSVITTNTVHEIITMKGDMSLEEYVRYIYDTGGRGKYDWKRELLNINRITNSQGTELLEVVSKSMLIEDNPVQIKEKEYYIEYGKGWINIFSNKSYWNGDKEAAYKKLLDSFKITNTEINVSKWNVYRNKEYKFEIMHPESWKVEDIRDSGIRRFIVFKDSSILRILPSGGLYNEFECSPYWQGDGRISDKKYIAYNCNKNNDDMDSYVYHFIDELPQNWLSCGEELDYCGRLDSFPDNRQNFHILKQILSTFKFIEVEKDTSTWQTYRNEEYGFEVEYPEEWSEEGEFKYPLSIRFTKYEEAPEILGPNDYALTRTKGDLERIKNRIEKGESIDITKNDGVSADITKIDGVNSELLTGFDTPGGVFYSQLTFFKEKDLIELWVVLPLGPFAWNERNLVDIAKIQIKNREVDTQTLNVIDKFNNMVSTLKFTN